MSLTEGTGTCIVCNHKTLTRFGSVGYFQHDFCPNCGVGFGEASGGHSDGEKKKIVSLLIS